MVRALILSLVFLAGCQSTGGTFCDLSSPIRLTDEQIASLSDQQVAQFLGHNERGVRLCGWRA